MTSKQKRILALLLLAGALYFVLFIFPNATGAKDPAMLSIFEPDESAQYTHPMRMLSPGKSFTQNLNKFINYQHYYYGYPFYIVSIVFALLPLKLLVGIGNTAYNMLAMRQMVSVLPMVLAVLVLVWTQTRFKSYRLSLGLFLFLLTVPAVFKNSSWWHPDSLLLLFIALTFFFLDRDDLRFGKNFYLAAVAVGLATGTKLIGLFFFLAIPLYIFIGWRQKRLTLGRAALCAALFVTIMFVTFVASNPFLLNPAQRERAIRIQTKQAEAMSQGWSVLYSKGPLAWLPLIQTMYGSLAFVALAFGVAVLNLWKGQRRVLHALILAFAIPFLVYVLFTIVIKPTHFLLPAALPLYSALAGIFAVIPWPRRAPTPPARAGAQAGVPAQPAGAGSPDRSKVQPNAEPPQAPPAAWPTWLPWAWAGLVILVGGWQIAYNLGWDVAHYREVLHREKDSAEIQFYYALESDYLTRLPADLPLRVYRDVRTYFGSPHWGAETGARPTGYDRFQADNTDLILIWNQRALDYTNEGVLDIALDRQAMEAAHQFYTDVKKGEVTGYTLLLRSDCCSAFLKDELYAQYLTP